MSFFKNANLQNIVRVFLSHPAYTMILVALLTALGIWRVQGIRLDADMVSLLPKDDPAVEVYRKSQIRFPQINALVMEIENPEKILPILEKEIDRIPKVSRVQSMSLHGKQLLLVYPSTSPSDISASRLLMERLSKLFLKHKLKYSLTGTPAFLVESSDAFSSDLRRASWIALIAVVIFFLFFYRIGWLALFSLMPIGVGILWGLALYSTNSTRLTLLAAVVPTLLIGIGIDYSIHVIQSVRVLFNEEKDRMSIVGKAVSKLLLPLTACALTTAAAFFSLTAARLNGLSDMGWAGGWITLCTFAATILILPHFLVRCPERWLTHKDLIGILMPRMEIWCSRHRRWFLSAAFIATGLSILGSVKVGVLNDQTKLENPNLSARVFQKRLAAEFGLSASPLLATFSTLDDMDSFLSAFYVMETPLSHITNLQPLGDSDPALLVHAKGNLFQKQEYQAVRDDIETLKLSAGVKRMELTGSPVINQKLTEKIWTDAPRILIIATLLVVVVSLIFLRSILDSLLAIIPLACGLLWTAGLMGVVQSPLTMMTIAVAPLILGIGVDNGLHLLVARRRHRARMDQIFRETGTAMVATTATTVVGFVAFCTASSPGLVQLGWEAAAGLSFCLIASLFVLPHLCGNKTAPDEALIHRGESK